MEETISAAVRCEPLITNPTSSLCSNRVPWAIISACTVTCALLILLLRFMLAAENRRRDAEKRDDTFDDIYLSKELSDGSKEEKRVDRVRLLTYPRSMGLLTLFLPWPGVP